MTGRGNRAMMRRRVSMPSRPGISTSRVMTSGSRFGIACIAAASGAEAMQAIPNLDPDVITLDVEMPGLDGMETLRRIMALFPRPVIMVSSVTLKDAETTFNALAAGAFDYVPKQLSSTSLDIHHIQGDLVAKIKGAAASRHSWDGNVPRKLPRAEPRARATLPPTAAIVALGISTGGPKAL